MFRIVILMRSRSYLPVIMITVLFLFSSLQIVLEDVASENAESRGDPDLPLIVYGTYTIVGHEAWRDVHVGAGSRL